MELRKKPIPAPIARATTSRPVVPTVLRRSLPTFQTVAALLTATAALACQKESPIEADPEPNRVVEVVKYMPSALPSTMVTAPPPVPPQPGMGALELAAEVPPPPPPKMPPPSPMKHPPMVKGGMKHVVPTPKAPKLGGDVAAVSPI